MSTHTLKSKNGKHVKIESVSALRTSAKAIVKKGAVKIPPALKSHPIHTDEPRPENEPIPVMPAQEPIPTPEQEPEMAEVLDRLSETLDEQEHQQEPVNSEPEPEPESKKNPNQGVDRVTVVTKVRVEPLTQYFDEEQQAFLLKTYETNILEAGVKVTQMQDDYDLYKQQFEEIKTKYDALQHSIESSKRMIESIHKMRLQKPDQEVTVMREESHTKKTRKLKGPKNTNIPWKELALKTLAKTDHFLFLHELWDAVLDANPEIKKGLETDTKRRIKLKSSTIMNWGKQASPGYLANGKSAFAFYREKIGLLEWLKENMEPAEKYMKDFVFQGGR